MTEDDLLELLNIFLPETVEGWLAAVIIVCAIVAVAVPPPAENAHPALRVCHRIICIVGMGAGKMRAAGKIGKLGKIAKIFGGKK